MYLPSVYTFRVKAVRLTRHARNRLRWRDIPIELVEQTARVPGWEEASRGGRINRWKRVEGRFLRVTVREQPDRIVVITAAFKQVGPKREGTL
jgi:hypothetical protein